MSNPLKTRAGMIAGTAVAVLALAGIAGATVANADDSTRAPSASSSPSAGTDDTARDAARPAEEALTGDAAAKVQAAVEAKYPGATIERMEKDGDGTSVYEAHITKADGTHVTVMIDASLAITGEEAMGQAGPGRHGGGAGRPAEEALTGDAAAKVQAAVEATYPGATIERMEKDGDGTSVYEAHITKADGTHVTVMFDAGFAITGEEAMGLRGPGGPGGHGGRGHHGPDADADRAHDAGTATPSSTTAA